VRTRPHTIVNAIAEKVNVAYPGICKLTTYYHYTVVHSSAIAGAYALLQLSVLKVRASPMVLYVVLLLVLVLEHCCYVVCAQCLRVTDYVKHCVL
jgi:hypothetical protein